MREGWRALVRLTYVAAVTAYALALTMKAAERARLPGRTRSV
jgi:hypothetical protein